MYVNLALINVTALGFVFLCLVYPMTFVSLDCPFLLPFRYSLTFIVLDQYVLVGSLYR
jgi:hypothetical protein